MPAQSSFDYAIIRLVPHVEREEFINVGVILFCRTRRCLIARIELDRQREDHETYLTEQDAEREQIKVELARLRLENEKLKAESRLIVLRGNLIEKITQELDLNNISPAQAFVLVKALNQDSTESDIFMAQGQLDQMQADAELKKAEARQAGYDADYAEYKMNESMKGSDV